jgi:hypothetical protein
VPKRLLLRAVKPGLSRLARSIGAQPRGAGVTVVQCLSEPSRKQFLLFFSRLQPTWGRSTVGAAGIIRAVVGLGKPIELFRRLEESSFTAA